MAIAISATPRIGSVRRDQPSGHGLARNQSYPRPWTSSSPAATERWRPVEYLAQLVGASLTLATTGNLLVAKELFLGFLYGMRYGGQPSAADLDKAAASNGVGQHEHGEFGLHPHGEPSFTDAEVAHLEAQGLHVDRHHARVLDHRGRELTPLHVGSMLASFRDAADGGDGGTADVSKGALGFPGAPVTGATGCSVSGPGESAPDVAHLDLRG